METSVLLHQNKMIKINKNIKNPFTKFSSTFRKLTELQRHFQKYGWLSLSQIIKKKEILLIQNELNKISKNFCGTNFESAILIFNKNKDKDKLYLLCSLAERTSSYLLLVEKFDKLLKKINKKNTPVISLGQFILPGPPEDKRLIYNFHQENNYYKKFDNVTSFHFPIFRNTNLNNGSMSVLSRSHKLKMIKNNELQKKRGGFLSIIPKNIDKLVEKHDHLTFNLKLGDVLIFDGNLIHKSNPNLSTKSRIVGIHRFSQI